MKPGKNEYAEYYEKYIGLLGDQNVMDVLVNFNTTVQLIRTLTPEKAAFVYAPGKWRVKQLIGHVIDTERIMAYRALRIARNDTQPLPGFDQDEYVKYGNAQRRSVAELADEFETVRKSNLFLFSSFNNEEMKRQGTASGYEVTVRALIYIVAGHELHHVKILKERYLNI